MKKLILLLSLSFVMSTTASWANPVYQLYASQKDQQTLHTLCGFQTINKERWQRKVTDLVANLQAAHPSNGEKIPIEVDYQWQDHIQDGYLEGRVVFRAKGAEVSYWRAQFPYPEVCREASSQKRLWLFRDEQVIPHICLEHVALKTGEDNASIQTTDVIHAPANTMSIGLCAKKPYQPGYYQVELLSNKYNTLIHQGEGCWSLGERLCAQATSCSVSNDSIIQPERGETPLFDFEAIFDAKLAVSLSDTLLVPISMPVGLFTYNSKTRTFTRLNSKGDPEESYACVGSDKPLTLRLDPIFSAEQFDTCTKILHYCVFPVSICMDSAVLKDKQQFSTLIEELDALDDSHWICFRGEVDFKHFYLGSIRQLASLPCNLEFEHLIIDTEKKSSCFVEVVPEHAKRYILRLSASSEAKKVLKKSPKFVVDNNHVTD